jgi:hypothetical protein
MRALSFLILTACLLNLSCGGSSTPPAPEQTFAGVVDDFYPAAVVFADQVSKEFEQNALDPEELHRSGGFAQLLAASHKLVPDFPITAEDREALAFFALYLGQVPTKPEAWQLGLQRETGNEGAAIASLKLPLDDFWLLPFHVRLSPDKKKGWKLASWPPRDRRAFQPYPADSGILHLSSWAAGAVPQEVQARFKQQFGSDIPAGSAYAQVEWRQTVLYHSLADGAEGADPWQRLKGVVQDVLLPAQIADEEGLPTGALVILADPDVPASLLLGVLESLAQSKTRWPQLWIGRPGEIVDTCHLVDQRRAWEPQATEVILTAGGSEDEWSAALAGSSSTGAVGLRLAPEMPTSQWFAELARLHQRKLTRIFIALPAP